MRTPVWFLGGFKVMLGSEARYDAGVLTLHIPVADKAKARKIEITAGGESKAVEAA